MLSEAKHVCTLWKTNAGVLRCARSIRYGAARRMRDAEPAFRQPLRAGKPEKRTGGDFAISTRHGWYIRLNLGRSETVHRPSLTRPSKSTSAPSCKILGPNELVICPRLPPQTPTVVIEQNALGLYQCGVLVKFRVSARTFKPNRSVILKFRKRLKSSCANPGPRSQERPRPALPIRTFSTGTRAVVLNQSCPGPVPLIMSSVPE